MEVGSRPVWIVQAVEILKLVVVGSPCVPRSSDGTITAPLEITWYGGGLLEGASNPPVQFWLTSDGRVPQNDQRDTAHLLVLTAPGSPHEVRTVRVDVGSAPPEGEIAGGVDAVTLSEGGPSVALDVGQYRMLTVFDPEGVNRTVSAPSSDLILVCDPGRSSDTGRQP